MVGAGVRGPPGERLGPRRQHRALPDHRGTLSPLHPRRRRARLRPCRDHRARRRRRRECRLGLGLPLRHPPRQHGDGRDRPPGRGPRARGWALGPRRHGGDRGRRNRPPRPALGRREDLPGPPRRRARRDRDEHGGGDDPGPQDRPLGPRPPLDRGRRRGRPSLRHARARGHRLVRRRGDGPRLPPCIRRAALGRHGERPHRSRARRRPPRPGRLGRGGPGRARHHAGAGRGALGGHRGRRARPRPRRRGPRAHLAPRSPHGLPDDGAPG